MALEKLELIPDQTGYKYGPDGSSITTKLDGGLSKSRLDHANSSAIVNCIWRLKDYNYQYLNAFYKAQTQKGSNPFLIDLLIDQPFIEEYEAKFVPDSWQPIESTAGLTFEVNAELEVVPVFDEEFAQGIVDTYTPEGYAYLHNLEELIHIYLP